MDIIESLGGSEEQKQQIREIYDLYDTSLAPRRKEELKIKLDKMRNGAINKGYIED